MAASLVATAAQDLVPIVTGLGSVARSVTDAHLPAWVGYAQAAATLLVMVFTAVAAWAAARSAAAAQLSAAAADGSVRASLEATEYERVRDLVARFDDESYFMRFWRLNRMTRGMPFESVSYLSGCAESDAGLRAIWLDAIGENPNSLRADMYSVYNFALRLNAWLARSRNGELCPVDVAYVNDLFGPHLVGTLLNHRELACRFTPPVDRTRDYYLRYYGLSDATYTRLVDALLADLLDRDRLHSGQRGTFVRSREAVNAHVAAVVSPHPQD